MLVDNVTTADPFVPPKQVASVPTAEPVNAAVEPIVTEIELDAQPAVDVATTVCEPDVNPLIVNGFVEYGVDGPPSTL